MITLNYTYRIYPDAEQVESLNEWLETCRGVYNYAQCLTAMLEAYTESKITV